MYFFHGLFSKTGLLSGKTNGLAVNPSDCQLIIQNIRFLLRNGEQFFNDMKECGVQLQTFRRHAGNCLIGNMMQSIAGLEELSLNERWNIRKRTGR